MKNANLVPRVLWKRGSKNAPDHASDTSSKSIDRECLGESRTEIKQSTHPVRNQDRLYPDQEQCNLEKELKLVVPVKTDFVTNNHAIKQVLTTCAESSFSTVEVLSVRI